MNFRFTFIDFNTLTEMKTGIYVLITIASIHTFTLLCLFSYKYFNEKKSEDKNVKIEEDKKNKEDKEDKKNKKDADKEDVDKEDVDKEDVDKEDVEMEDIDVEKKTYMNMVIFENKRDELDKLITKLSTIQNNLEIVREKLTELNNTSI